MAQMHGEPENVAGPGQSFLKLLARHGGSRLCGKHHNRCSFVRRAQNESGLRF